MSVISPSVPNHQVKLFSTASGMVMDAELRK